MCSGNCSFCVHLCVCTAMCNIWAQQQVCLKVAMSCVICLDASAKARRVCGCSARVCLRCLMALLDRGRDRCVLCGSRFRSNAVVKACRQALENVDNDRDRAGRHVKLAVAYSMTGLPRRALRHLAIAKRFAAPGSIEAHNMQLEIASNLLETGSTAEAERCLLSVMDMILEMTPVTLASALLYTSCCTLLARTNLNFGKFAPAKSWLRRAMAFQDEPQFEFQLAESLQLEAQILRCEGNLGEAKESLQKALRITTRGETDEGLIANIQIDLAMLEIQLGQRDAARARLSRTLPILRKRKHDSFADDLLEIGSQALSYIVSPTRRLRMKTWPEKVE